MIAFKLVVVKKSRNESGYLGNFDNPLNEVSLAEIAAPPPRFTELQVKRNCELKEFIEENKLEFKRGCTFYEFIHEIENISDKQEVVLKDKVITLCIVHRMFNKILFSFRSCRALESTSLERKLLRRLELQEKE